MVAEEIIEEVKEEDNGPPAKAPRIELMPQRSINAKPSQSWNRSIGALAKKRPLANLVRSKKDNEHEKVSTTIVSTDVASKGDASKKTATTTAGLALLAGYSGSDSDSN